MNFLIAIVRHVPKGAQKLVSSPGDKAVGIHDDTEYEQFPVGRRVHHVQLRRAKAAGHRVLCRGVEMELLQRVGRARVLQLEVCAFLAGFVECHLKGMIVAKLDPFVASAVCYYELWRAERRVDVGRSEIDGRLAGARAHIRISTKVGRNTPASRPALSGGGTSHSR